MASHNSKVKISRLRMKTHSRSHSHSLHTLLFVALLVSQGITSTQSNADYDDGDDFQSNSAGEATAANDEFYGSDLIQQEIESIEKLHNEHDEEAEREAQTKISLNQTNIEAESTQTRSKATAPALKNDNIDSEEMYDHFNPKSTSEAKSEVDGHQLPMTVPTTSIPAYVRNPKSQQFLRTDELDSSDYVNDNAKHSNIDDTLISDRMDMEDIVPMAMKYYQSGAKVIGLMDHNDNDKLKVHLPVAPALNATSTSAPTTLPVPLPQQQLPINEAPQQFQTSNSDEDYYEDLRESDEVPHDSATYTSTLGPLAEPRNIAAARSDVAPSDITRRSSTVAPPSITAANIDIDAQLTTDNPAVMAAVITTHAATTPYETSLRESATLVPTVVAVMATTAGVSDGATTVRLAGKQGKQINISRRKLLPHEQLRNYIEDAYIRMPLAVIVDPSSESLEKTKALWRDAMSTNLNIKIVLVSLNASGIPAAYNFNNTRQFLAGLNSIKEHTGGNSFVGILHASELVPYDSAVFISTATLPPHTELVQDAAITLLKKRIRLYVIWYGERAVSENETQEAVGGILGEVAIRSGGEIMHIIGSENSQELEGSTLTLVADAFRGSQEIDIPVDTTLSSLHVKIDTPMRLATLETPNGDINLKKLVKFKSHVLTLGADDQRLDAYVPLTKLRKATVYKLKMLPQSLQDEYSVFVRGERKPDMFLDEMIKRFDAYFLSGRAAYPSKFNEKHLQNRLTVDRVTHGNLKFHEDYDDDMPNNEDNDDGKEHKNGKSEVEIFSETEVHSTQPKSDKTAAAIPTAVVNAVNPNALAASNVLTRDVTKIEMGIQSQVLLAPGTMGQLQFEVTNTRSEAVYHSIQVVDERRFLLRLQPQTLFLRAGETAIVTVTVLVPNGTPQGTIDKITFTCHSGGTASLSLNLKVITTADAQDTTSPSLSWEFGSRCEYINSETANCAERFWTLDITAQDWQTGIMRLQTTPAGGLIYRNSYTVGSTEPLKATYIASCCEPKLTMTAYDIAGNQRTHNIDVRDIVLTEASIAAIVLGVLLLILLIALLVASIVWCCRRRRVSLDLPTYRSHSTRSME